MADRLDLGEPGRTNQQSTALRRAAALSLTILLIQACASGDLVAVTNLVADQCANPFSRDESGRTPLGAACEAGHVEVARYLIETAGVSPRSRGADGATPLHAAAKGGHLTVIRYLVEKQGVDPSIKDSDGRSPLEYTKNSVVREFLISHDVHGSQGNKFMPIDASISFSSSLPYQSPWNSHTNSSIILPFVGIPVTELLISGVSSKPTLTHTKPSQGEVTVGK